MNQAPLHFLRETPSGFLVGATTSQGVNLVLTLLALPISLGNILLHKISR